MVKTNKFKVGDRVAFYDDGHRHVGTIEEVDESCTSQSIFVNGSWLHPRQCRKLVKKKPLRRVWLVAQSVDEVIRADGARDLCVSANKVMNCDIEFVEVRR